MKIISKGANRVCSQKQFFKLTDTSFLYLIVKRFRKLRTLLTVNVMYPSPSLPQYRFTKPIRSHANYYINLHSILLIMFHFNYCGLAHYVII